MNKKGFAISIILYSMVFLLITILFAILSILKTRYTISSELRNDILKELNANDVLRDIVANLGENASIDYVQKYDVSNGAPIDVVSGDVTNYVYYYTSNTSANLAGQNGNVIFGNFCWQIVRTTATGGIKLLYNGEKTSDNKCTTSRTAGVGFVGSDGKSELTMTGSKTYGESFEIFDDGGTKKFRLLHKITATWDDSTYQDLIGKYVCGSSSAPTGSSDTCTYIWYIGMYRTSTKASGSRYSIGTNEHYSMIGKSPFNAYYDNLSLFGYMFNDGYRMKNRNMFSALSYINESSVSESYYYGTKAVWNSSTNMYDLKVDDGNGNYVTPTTTSTWANIYSTAVGMYTCKSATETSCATVSYIVGTTSSKMYSISLANNENIDTKSVTFKYGTGYEKNNNTYSLTGIDTATIILKDWYANYDSLPVNNSYMCSDMTSTSCTGNLYSVISSSRGIYYFSLSNNYIYGNSVTYSNGNYTIDNNTDPTKYRQVWDWPHEYSNMNNSHYTCFKAGTNDCGSSVFFIYYVSNTVSLYIELTGGEKIEDAIQKMYNVSNSNSNEVNKYNSAMKSAIDSWYETNLLSLSNYLDENEVYCNDRSILSLNGWSTTGDATSSPTLRFTNYDKPSTNDTKLTCTNITDRFSVNNNYAKLKYPIGFLTESERSLMQQYYAKSGKMYRTGTPYAFNPFFGIMRVVNAAGQSSSSYNLNSSYGIRPVITLKSGTRVSGEGTYNNPYIVKMGTTEEQGE